MYYNSADFEFTSALEATWQVVRQEIEQINSRDFVEWPERHLYGKGFLVYMRLG
jgi:ornithine lipid ester-linked acyl 2-hydroxylase